MHSTDDPPLPPADLRDHLAALRRSWWLVAAATALGLVAGFAAWSLLPRVYKSTASVLVLPTAQDANASGGRTHNRAVNLDTEAQLVRSGAVENRARAMRPAGGPPSADQVTVSVPPNSTVLAVTYSAGTAAAARAGAHAFATAYLANRTAGAAAFTAERLSALRTEATRTTGQVQQLDARLGAMTDDTAARRDLAAQRGALATRLAAVDQSINQLGSGTATTGRIITDAGLPDSPTRPSRPVDLAAGGLLGLLAGLAAAVLRGALDRRITRPSDVTRRAGIPVLASLPADEPAHPHAPAEEGAHRFGRLRNELLAMLPGQDGGILLIAGAADPSAAPLVATNLAAALARAGHDTVLVNADPAGLPVPLAGVPDSPGLTDALAADGAPRVHPHPVPDEPRLSVLPAGGHDADGLLQHRAAGGILLGLRAGAGWVVVAAPSLAAGPDAQSLAAHADAALLAVTLRATRRAHLRDAVDQLHAVGTALLGAVTVPPAALPRRPAPIPAARDAAPDGAPAETVPAG